MMETASFILLYLVAPCLVAAAPGLALTIGGRWLAGGVLTLVGGASPVAVLYVLILSTAGDDIGPAVIVLPLLPWIVAIPLALAESIFAAIYWGASRP